MIQNYQHWKLNEALDRRAKMDHVRKFLTQEQIDWCDRHIEKAWKVDENGEVAVNKDLKLIEVDDIVLFPVQFADVDGDFNCIRASKLISLKGSPRKVEGSVTFKYCDNLTSLEGGPLEALGYHCEGMSSLRTLKGAPQKVRSFSANYCDKLTSLEGAPQEVRRFETKGCKNLKTLNGAPQEAFSFNCSDSPNLVTLKGGPLKVDSFLCVLCPKLVSLEGAPQEVVAKDYDTLLHCKNLDYGNFDCSECKNLTSLKGGPKIVKGKFVVDECPNLVSLEGAPHKAGAFECYDCVKLMSLEGVTQELKYLWLSIENLKTLKGAPPKVDIYDLTGCTNLISLTHAPVTTEARLSYNNFNYKTEPLDATDFPNLDPFEMEVIQDDKLKSDWIKSKLDIKDFVHSIRGILQGILKTKEIKKLNQKFGL